MSERSSAAVRRAAALFAAAIVLGGCVSQQARRDAVDAINREFRREYDDKLDKFGTRTVSAKPDDALDATRAALKRLGMTVQHESPGLGLITADAAAPQPLSKAEWDRAAAADLPKARALLVPHVGPLANLFTFEPEGLDIVINATVVAADAGSQVSFTMRMRERAPPKSDLPRREYPPPTAVEIGLEKLFAEVDNNLASRGRARPR